MSRRIQMTRQKPWRHLSPDAKIVDRRSPWGNPHLVDDPCPECDGAVHDPAEAVELFRAYLARKPSLVTRARRSIAGKDLACWCRIGEPCHADVWLEILNPTIGSLANCADYGASYRDAAIALWGDAGAYIHDTYARTREQHFPELPEQIPMVIGITAYGACAGLTRPNWEHGPRITVFSALFGHGARHIDDLLVHEMLHIWLSSTGRDTQHASDDWYEAVRRLSPAVLGHDVEVWRGADRKSVRVPNPAWEKGNGKPKTIVRKVRDETAVAHQIVARWPTSFRPDDYDWGEPISCPTY